MKHLIPSKPSLGAEELALVQKVFDSSWLGMGTFVSEFEAEVEAFIGKGTVVAVNSGTSALHLALESIGVGKGDEVIVPSLTFCASVQVITALGAIPVFCEVNTGNLCIAIDDVKSKITSRTKAIIPVHYCGIACDMDALLAIKDELGIRIIEDAAHAFGSSSKGRMIGSFGDICCFSFDPIKNITCGEGGAIVEHDGELADLMRKKRMLGIDKHGWIRYNNHQNKDYDVTTQGFRYHMNNVNAAIGLAQMKKIAAFREKKTGLVQLYNERLASIKAIALLEWNLSETFPFAYVLRVASEYRDLLVAYLKEQDIVTGLNYIPNHLQRYFNTTDTLPVTEQLFKEIITLPLHCDLDVKEVEYVIACIETFFVGQMAVKSFGLEEEVPNA